MYMSLFFLYEAADRFASLDADAARQVVRVLAQATEPMAAADTDVGAPTEFVDVVRHIHTAQADLWLGAFAERQDLTIVSLEFKDPGEALQTRMRALARAHKRPTIGGLSLEERPTDIQESLRALLEEHRWLFGKSSALLDRMSVATVGVGGTGTEILRYTHSALARQLTRSARRWRTTQARRDFKDVLQEASTAPQVVERDGQEVLIIDRDLLERFEQPLSGAALAARFASNRLPTLNFATEPPSDPEPQIHLGARV
jgi:hypothetical protein